MFLPSPWLSSQITAHTDHTLATYLSRVNEHPGLPFEVLPSERFLSLSFRAIPERSYSAPVVLYQMVPICCAETFIRWARGARSFPLSIN